MKYLIIAALVSVVLVLIYARVRPYLKLIRKVVSRFKRRPLRSDDCAQRHKIAFEEQAGAV